MPKKKDTTARKSRRRGAKPSNAVVSRFLARFRTAGEVARQHVLATVVIIVCLLGAAIWGVVALVTSPEIGPEVGNLAPEFSLRTTDGENVTLRDFRGRMVMLSFWGDLGNHDGGLEQEIHSIQALRHKWSSEELAILGITASSDKDELREFISRYDLAFPAVLDSEGVSTDYDIMHHPVHFFIDARGIIRLATLGHFGSQDEIEDILNSIKANTDMKGIAPTISDVSVSATDKSAVITWVTDEPATSDAIVRDTEHGFRLLTSPDETPVTDHAVALDGLAPDTTYHFQVLSGYSLLNQARSRKYSFTSGTDIGPPVISFVGIQDIGDTSITIEYVTDEPATTQVEYWTIFSTTLETALDEELRWIHNVTLSRLEPDTDYHVLLKSRDSSGHEGHLRMAGIRTRTALQVGPEVGNRAPDFTLLTLDGERVTLSDFRGKMVILNFWLTVCRACEAEMPHLQAVFDEWPDDTLAILSINVRESAPTVRSFVESQGLTFPVLLDLEGVVDEVYDYSFFPTAFFIDADGIIREVKEGRFHSPEEIKSILNSL